MNTILRCLPPAQYFRASVFLSRFSYLLSGLNFIIPLPRGFCYCPFSLFTSLRTSRTVPPLNTATLVTSVWTWETLSSAFLKKQLLLMKYMLSIFCISLHLMKIRPTKFLIENKVTGKQIERVTQRCRKPWNSYFVQLN